MNKSRDEGGKTPEFRRFEAAVKMILAVSKSELQTRVNKWNAQKPHRRRSKNSRVTD